MNGLADEADLLLRFDVLTRPSSPSYWTARDRTANVHLYRLAAEILPRVGWHCQDCPVRSRCWAWGERADPPYQCPLCRPRRLVGAVTEPRTVRRHLVTLELPPGRSVPAA